ncbi:hypothetical protein pb186bvf_000935 [Paramecium bursaria]
MKKKCKFCISDARKQVSKVMHDKYFEAFNFYFAKPVNELLAQVPNVSHVISFKDYQMYDEQQELLKRFYQNEEVKPRIEILTEFYVTNYKQIHPNLLITDVHQQMQKRNSKLDKLFYQRLQQSTNSEQRPLVSDKVLNSKLTIHSHISYSSEEHDIYGENDQIQNHIRLDLRGLRIIRNLKQLNHSELEEDNMMIEDAFQILQIPSSTKSQRSNLPTLFYKQIKNRRTVDLRDKKLCGSKSESKNSQSSFKPAEDDEPKLQRVNSDSSTIQKMLKEYQNLKNRQQQNSTSSLIQGYQGSQVNGSQHSQKQEVLKKVYQQRNRSQIDKIAKGGCLTERNTKRPIISEELISKITDIQRKHDIKPEIKYMIPSQYNTGQQKQQLKAKSSNSRKITNDLITKSQSNQSVKLNNQKTDEMVKKYIQFAQKSLQQKKKFDFKLNLQGLQEEQEDDISSKRKDFLSERAIGQSEMFNSHRKIVLK